MLPQDFVELSIEGWVFLVISVAALVWGFLGKHSRLLYLSCLGVFILGLLWDWSWRKENVFDSSPNLLIAAVFTWPMLAALAGHWLYQSLLALPFQLVESLFSGKIS